MRKPPEQLEDLPQLPQAAPVPPGMVRQVRRYTVITPLFGGGVEGGVNDPLTLVRGASIRGQLRFWWRATRGGQCGGNLQKLKADEGRIWGSASDNDGSGTTGVQIAVEVTQPGERDQPYELNQSNKPQSRRASKAPAYAAFPLQPSREEIEQPNFVLKSVRVDVHFTLSLCYDQAYHSEVAAALWAWETFGGIGARTRRGFGALQCDSIQEQHPNQPVINVPVERAPATDTRALARWLDASLVRHIPADAAWPPNVPHLSRALRWATVRPSNEALPPWRFLIERLSTFRHQRPKHDRLTRNGRVSIPGRNYWPEPDAIRELVLKGRWARPYRDRNGNDHDHSAPLYRVNGRVVVKFPRAAFGLPIVIKFKDEDARYGDPAGQFTLRGQPTAPHDAKQKHEFERLASPLILRPLRCASGYAGLAVVLDGIRLPAALRLEAQQYAPQDGLQAQLEADEAREIQAIDGNQPAGRSLLEFDGQIELDVLAAFLKYLQE
jgi:CRISPR-associated protein Cmr1